MTLLEKIYHGNTLLDWLIAIGVIIAVFSLLTIAQRLAIRRLSNIAAVAESEFASLLINILKQPQFLILLVLSGYAASFAITLKPLLGIPWEKMVVLILIVQAGLWAGTGISFALNRAIRKRLDEDKASVTTMTFLAFVARFALWSIILLLILDNLGVSITGLIAGLGIGGIAIALAVQNILGDLLASLAIVLDKPFVIGDLVVVDSLSGTIEHIGLKTTRIRSSSGEQLIFSNNDLLRSRIRNYGRMAERRVVFTFGVAYETSLEQLRLIKEIVQQSFEPMEHARLLRVHFKEYGDASLNYEVAYCLDTADYTLCMDVQEAVNLQLFQRFQEKNIKFAYSSRTLFIQRDGSSAFGKRD
ncbi:MAG: mechanosensitive ion channel family protein [Syntrophaceae bacterium]|nr:mechanosensitive ion channel family protein [Syntrophaceae bacterium]